MAQRVLSCGCGIFKRWKTFLLNTQRSFSAEGQNGAAQSSSGSNAVTKTNISKLLTLRSVNNSNKQSGQLVLLFDWLYAKPAAVDKYCKLYHDQGLDVLTINGRLAHFMWPPEGYKLAESILTYTLEEHKDDVIVHAFSVGAYIFTLCLMLSRREPDKYGAFRDKVKGQVFDSVVLGSYDHMSTGISVALPGSNLMRKPILQMMDVYYNMTKETTRDEYDKLVDLFKVDPIMAPTLLFYSYNDPMCYVPAMEEMIANWRRDMSDLDVTSKCWEKSIHAAHLKFHREEYIDVWGAWMAKIGQKP